MSVASPNWTAFPPSLLLLTTMLLGPVAAALDQGSLSDPRPGRWSLDQSGRLRSATLRALDELGQEIRNSTGHEQVVVCVDSTDSENQRTFATRLFNRWGLGDHVRNDGVLLFVALGDRRVEFVLGDGVDDDQQVAVSQAIVDQDMLPRFRAGDADGAVLAGAQAAARRLLGYSARTDNPSPAYTAPPINVFVGGRVAQTDQPVEAETDRPAPVPTAYPTTPKPSAYSSDPSLGQASWMTLGLAGGGGAAGVWFLRRWLRNRPRSCDRCRQPMVRLGEYEDDRHLDHGEQTEERVGSVDYDIWCCTACPHVMKLRYGTWFTSYARCPRCNAVTKSSNETTLVHADYDHGGQVRVDEACVACDFRNSYTRSTPRKTRPANGGRSGISLGGGSGGGGRSSGRGGGGGW